MPITTVEIRPKSLLLLQQPPGMLSPELLGLLQHTIQANYTIKHAFHIPERRKKRHEFSNILASSANWVIGLG